MIEVPNWLRELGLVEPRTNNIKNKELKTKTQIILVFKRTEQNRDYIDKRSKFD